jgi:hypothetical protein
MMKLTQKGMGIRPFPWQVEASQSRLQSGNEPVEERKVTRNRNGVLEDEQIWKVTQTVQ